MTDATLYKIFKTDGHTGILLPKELLEKAGLRDGSIVTMEVREGSIVITLHQPER